MITKWKNDKYTETTILNQNQNCKNNANDWGPQIKQKQKHLRENF